jgi:small multidrug resistance pump
MFIKLNNLNNIIYPIASNNNIVSYNNIASYNNSIISYNCYNGFRNSNIEMILKPTNAEIFLFSSILLETISTACLKKTLINKLWFIPVYTGYGLSFYMFPKSLTQFTLSSAYSIWCGLGMLLTFIIDKIIYNQIITRQKMLGCLILIYGIKLIK